MQPACSFDCQLEYATRAAMKSAASRKANERKETKAKLEKLKPRSQWMKETQAAVNAYVRARDEGMPCISCGITNPVQWHAGHYLSRGAHPELALEESNIHRQCSQCNDHLSGNQIQFRKGLIERYGQPLVDWLESHHEPKKYTIEQLKAIRDEYRAKLKALKKES